MTFNKGSTIINNIFRQASYIQMYKTDSTSIARNMYSTYCYQLYRLIPYNDLTSLTYCVTYETIVENPHEPWDRYYHMLSINKNITWDIVYANLDKPWYYNWLSCNDNITWEIIQANDKPWNYQDVSFNKNITWDIVQAHDKPWDYKFLSCNENITWDIVQANDKPWNYDFLSQNKNITWEIVQANDKPWNYKILSYNPNITWDIVQANDKEWDYSNLSLNPNITWDIVQANPEKPWNYGNLSLNQSIQWDIIKKHPDKKWFSYRRDMIDMPDYFQHLHLFIHETHHDQMVETISNKIKYFREIVKEELMSVVWHPSRVDKWKHLDDF